MGNQEQKHSFCLDVLTGGISRRNQLYAFLERQVLDEVKAFEGASVKVGKHRGQTIVRVVTSKAEEVKKLIQEEFQGVSGEFLAFESFRIWFSEYDATHIDAWVMDIDARIPKSNQMVSA